MLHQFNRLYLLICPAASAQMENLGRASVAQTMGWITNAPCVEASAGRLTYFILRAVSTNIDTTWSAPIL